MVFIAAVSSGSISYSWRRQQAFSRVLPQDTFIYTSGEVSAGILIDQKYMLSFMPLIDKIILSLKRQNNWDIDAVFPPAPVHSVIMWIFCIHTSFPYPVLISYPCHCSLLLQLCQFLAVPFIFVLCRLIFNPDQFPDLVHRATPQKTLVQQQELTGVEISDQWRKCFKIALFAKCFVRKASRTP